MPVRWRILSAFILLMSVATVIVATRLQVSSDLSMFLPGGASWPQQVLVEELRKGANGRLILLAIEGGDSAVRARASQELAAALQHSGHFVYVTNGSGSLPGRERSLLMTNRYLLSDGGSAEELFSAAGLRGMLEARLADLASVAAPLIKTYLANDPGLAGLAVLRQWAGERDIRKSNGVWVSPDQQRALLLAYPRSAGSNLDEQEQLARKIRGEFVATAAKVNGSSLALILSGPAMIAVDSRNEIRSDAQWLSVFASVTAMLFLYLAFRSWRVVMFGILPLAGGALAGLAITTLVYGQVHGIAIAFGVTLIGIAVDYPMHFYSHAAGSMGGPALGIQRIWPTLRLGVMTTLVGFAALVFAGYGGLTQLGVFSIAGLTAAAAITRFVLPILTPSSFELPVALPGVQQRLLQFARFLGRLRSVVLLLTVAAATTLVMIGNDLWQTDASRMAPLSDEVRKRDARLRQDLNAPFADEMLLVRGASAEAVLQKLETINERLLQLKQRNQLQSFEIASRYLPSVARQQQRQARLPTAESLRADLSWAARGLPFRADLFSTFVSEVAAARVAKPVTLADFHGTMLAERLEPLLFEFGEYWVAPVLLYGVSDSASLPVLADNFGDSVSYVHTRNVTREMMTAYRQHSLTVFLYGALAILVVLILGLGSLKLALRTLLVPLSVVLLTMPLVYVMVDGGLGLFHLVALLLVVGLGIDYALFFNRLYRREQEWHSTFPALWKSWLTTVLVFGSLALSDTVVLQAIGLTVSIGVSLCFVLGAVWMRRRPVTIPGHG
ncbi:MAG: hypothetical protein OEZ10_05265 [Gammaproteobacteria bacterium]|nr:hypothetical protein [Gammaproteobacteria bacterium]